LHTFRKFWLSAMDARDLKRKFQSDDSTLMYVLKIEALQIPYEATRISDVYVIQLTTLTSLEY